MLDAQVDTSEGFRRYVFTGTPDDDSIVECIRQIWTRPDYDPELAEIYDRREATR